METVDVREKLARARELCPGLPEGAYSFAQYLAECLDVPVVPMGLVLKIAEAIEEIKSGRPRQRANKVPQYLAEYWRDALEHAELVLQIIDATTGEEFAGEVRAACKKCFGWEVARRTEISDETAYPPYIKAALDWWTGAIQQDRKTVEAGGMLLPALGKQFSEKEIMAFRASLAEHIDAELERYGSACLRVDYRPDRTLAEAGEAAGIDHNLALFLFPSKTTMHITKDQVKVAAGYGADFVTIWTKT